MYDLMQYYFVYIYMDYINYKSLCNLSTLIGKVWVNDDQMMNEW